MKTVIKAPEEIIVPHGNKSLFLAGSIEMGKAEDWQTKLTNELLNTIDNITILNPRRDDFKVWEEQSINNPYFYGQVDWEHQGLDKADYVIIYFDPKTQAPISLMELGLIKDKKNVYVCCPEGFWRKGNVDFVCKKYKIKELENYMDLIEELKYKVGIKLKKDKE